LQPQLGISSEEVRGVVEEPEEGNIENGSENWNEYHEDIIPPNF
jgi:hypothetical protein